MSIGESFGSSFGESRLSKVGLVLVRGVLPGALGYDSKEDAERTH